VAHRYRWDDFVLDLDGCSVERSGVPLALEPKAFNLLALLVARPGHVFTKQEIFEAIWPDTVVSDHALTRVVAQLRRALGDEAREARYIETVPTRGYRWLPQVELVSAPSSSRVIISPPSSPLPAATTAASAGVAAAASRSPFWPGVTAALLVALGVGGFLTWTERASPTAATAPPAVVPWPVQITTNAGLDLHPAFSPHGDAVAYVSDRSGALEISVRGLSGAATETALTDNGGQNVQPAWSPDGRLLAFHSARDGGIWVIPARGGVAKQLVPAGSDPAWSPHGTRIAFKSDEHADVTPGAFGAQSGSVLWMVDADGGNARQLTEPGRPLGGHASPTWMGDGRHLAFTVFEGGDNNGIWLLDLDTREPRMLVGGPGLYELAFAPDDSALYAAGGEPLVVRLPFDPTTGRVTGPRELIPVPGVAGVRGLSVSSDGRVAFAGLALSSQIWAQAVAADGSARGPARAVTSDTSRRNSSPVMSRDGAKIAYVSNRGGERPNIWVMDVDGRNAMQVTSDDSADLLPFWFPDGRRVAFLSNRGDTRGIWSVDIATRREELLVQTIAKRHEPIERLGTLGEIALSPSLTHAAFSVIAPPVANRRIYLTSLAGFAPRQVTDGAQWVGYPAWSPDERLLAVEIKDGSHTHAGVVDVETGAVRRLTNERGQTWVRSWSPDGRRIAAAAFRNGLWDLRWIDAVTGGERTITAATGPHVYMRYPEWSARGDVLVFERGELRGNIWTLALGGARPLTREW
jgi:Tol biopolymer transport system component/DNA-binding winged helix-turn-helix (wHTH) protein